MARRVVFYGRIPHGVVSRLVVEYGVEIFLSAARIEPWMAQALQTGEYGLLVVEESAAKADRLAALVTQRAIPVVRLRADDDVDAMVRTITGAVQWTPVKRAVSLLFTCNKGGVGKSTTACAVAWILAVERNARVLIVDDNPSQNNSVGLFLHHSVPLVSAADIAHPAETAPARIVSVRPGLDVLAIEDYMSVASGVAYKDALAFWGFVAGLGYDYVIVDTAPNLVLPENPDLWASINLASALMLDPGLSTLYITPFTPDAWGWDGIEKTRGLLERGGNLDRMIPVVVAIDASSVVENVPVWLQTGRLCDRMVVISHNHRIRERPGTLIAPQKWFQSPLKPYRALVERIVEITGAQDGH